MSQPNQLPPWESADLPEAPRITWRHLTRLIGPGIVMMGIQIGGGEWLFGPEITARYGGGLMWIATVAIVLQVFYNLECGRYALYCGEPVMVGFMRTRPGPAFWMGFILLLNLGALIPALSSQGAAAIAALVLNRPPSEADRPLVVTLAYVTLGAVVLPVLIGGKIYNTLQAIMTTKVLVVLGFCTVLAVLFVSPDNWWNICSGFFKFGQVPITDADGNDQVVNAFGHYWEHGEWPVIALANIAVLGGFAGYAGGGGLANSTYSNYVRDKGWGMGKLVGAIASAIGGHQVALSHVGKVFPLTDDNLARWRGWWRYIFIDQVLIWAPGCFAGMALPALISIQFAGSSPLFQAPKRMEWAQAIISADGLRHYEAFGPALKQVLWVATLLIGLLVLLPSQMSIVDDFSRRWTDMLWSGSPALRRRLKPHQVNRIYYTILSAYVTWTFFMAWVFSMYGTPKLQTLIVANLGNVAIALTGIHLWWINRSLLPAGIRPRWFNQLGVLGCSAFYLGIAFLVFKVNQWPVVLQWLKTLIGK